MTVATWLLAYTGQHGSRSPWAYALFGVLAVVVLSGFFLMFRRYGARGMADQALHRRGTGEE